MNKAKKMKILITTLSFLLVLAVSATAFAAVSIGNIVTIEPNVSTDGANTATNLGNQVIGIIQVVGIIISVAVLMILGIKYMMGSAEEKAEYKKTFIPYIVGAVILFAAAAFAQVIYNFAANIVGT